MLTINKLKTITPSQQEGFSNLSFVFPNQGLFVIEGNQQDQKHLFNFLTYQKKPPVGEILIGNKNTKSFTHEDIAFCYNWVLGIFSSQDFFLIDALTVKDNILIYLEIQNKTFNTKLTKTILQNVDLLDEIELDSLVNELTDQQKEKLMLAILMLKDCHIIVAFEPQPAFLTYFQQLAQTKLVLVFSNNIDTTNSLSYQKLIIQNNGFEIDKSLYVHNPKEVIKMNCFDFEITKQKYLHIKTKATKFLVETLTFVLFKIRSLPLKLHFLACGLRMPMNSIALIYNLLFSILTLSGIYNYCNGMILFLLLLILFLAIFFLFYGFFYGFSLAYRFENKNEVVLDKKKFRYLQKIGFKANQLVPIFKASTYYNLDLTTLNIFLILLSLFIHLFMLSQKSTDYKILDFKCIRFSFFVILFIVVPLLINNVVKQRVKKDLFKQYYNYL
ncbi:hypothetical protein [Candidatus Phytoplasma solani]|uniref:hypothetical protein n=1 Tax=Candidatus Phytoplasma solani TaxID=69896 RepID=UPI00358F7680